MSFSAAFAQRCCAVLLPPPPGNRLTGHAKAIGELRKQVAESKFVVTPEAVAKILVDKGQLTAFQARRLVASVNVFKLAHAA